MESCGGRCRNGTAERSSSVCASARSPVFRRTDIPPDSDYDSASVGERCPRLRTDCPVTRVNSCQSNPCQTFGSIPLFMNSNARTVKGTPGTPRPEPQSSLGRQNVSTAAGSSSSCKTNPGKATTARTGSIPKIIGRRHRSRIPATAIRRPVFPFSAR
jgi:hypothetical protein